MEEIKKRVLSVMGDIFGVSVSEIPNDASSSVFEKWDSLKHLMLLMALEEEFDVKFSDREMLNMSNLLLIIDILSVKCGAEK